MPSRCHFTIDDGIFLLFAEVCKGIAEESIRSAGREGLLRLDRGQAIVSRTPINKELHHNHNRYLTFYKSRFPPGQVASRVFQNSGFAHSHSGPIIPVIYRINAQTILWIKPERRIMEEIRTTDGEAAGKAPAGFSKAERVSCQRTYIMKMERIL
jgi:hypothetical protein